MSAPRFEPILGEPIIATTNDGRQLVVLDPEDAEQAERICQALVRAGAWKVIPASVDNTYAHRRDQVQQALRSLVADPKPEEPNGHAATVEASCGCDDNRRVYVRDVAAWRVDKPWQARCGSHDWATLTAVRVLSEGVAR